MYPHLTPSGGSKGLPLLVHLTLSRYVSLHTVNVMYPYLTPKRGTGRLPLVALLILSRQVPPSTTASLAHLEYRINLLIEIEST